MSYKIGFIGCGNMATAIIKGALNTDFISPIDIFVYDTDIKKATNFCNTSGVNNIKSIKELSRFVDIIFLCTKPQNIKEPILELKEEIKNKVIVSIAAGVKISTILSYLEKEIGIIRVMPNLCLLQCEGASALSFYNVNSNIKDYVFNIFSSCGKAVIVDEALLDTVTALSGSGPAYFFKFIKELVDSAVKLGLSYEDAYILAVQTLKGSAKVLENTKLSIEELIDMVSSKGGTTIAGLNALEDNGFKEAVSSCVNSAYKRSKELSKN